MEYRTPILKILGVCVNATRNHTYAQKGHRAAYIVDPLKISQSKNCAWIEEAQRAKPQVSGFYHFRPRF